LTGAGSGPIVATMGAPERKDVEAALEARRELGPAYEDEIVDSLLAKIDQRLAERKPQEPARVERRGAITPLLLGMFGCGVGATAIVASNDGTAWLAIFIWLAIAYAAREIIRYR